MEILMLVIFCIVLYTLLKIRPYTDSVQSEKIEKLKQRTRCAVCDQPVDHPGVHKKCFGKKLKPIPMNGIQDFKQ